jgi:hypothetical protein
MTEARDSKGKKMPNWVLILQIIEALPAVTQAIIDIIKEIQANGGTATPEQLTKLAVYSQFGKASHELLNYHAVTTEVVGSFTVKL